MIGKVTCTALAFTKKNSHLFHCSKPVTCVLILKRAASDQAAEGEAAMLLGLMKTRGCKEEFTPNPELLKDGKVRPIASLSGV